MEGITRILYAGDEVFWNHHDLGVIPAKVLKNEDGLCPKIFVKADLPDLKFPAQRWVMKVRLLE